MSESARPLYNYVAIEALDEGSFQYFPTTNIIKPQVSKSERFLTGRVLKKGPLVGPEVNVGDTVIYEMQSGHPGQTSPLDAALFGGTEKGSVYLIPVWPQALASPAAIEEEKARRMQAVLRLSERAEKRWLNELERAELSRHERRIRVLDQQRTLRGRGKKWDTMAGPAKGGGVVAIVMTHKEAING